MVDEENLREWVQQKLDAGVEPSRIKKSLEETGHDPAIVDEVQDPFDVDESDAGDSASGDELSMEEAGGGQEEESATGEESHAGGGGSGGLNSEIGAGSLEGGDEDSERAESPEGGDEGFSFPSLSMPDLPVWPAAVVAVLLIGFAGYVFVPWSSVGLSGLPSFSAPGVDIPGKDGGKVDSQEGGGCPDVGVRINSASSSGGTTTAEVLVTKNRAEVVLEVYDSGQLVGSITRKVEGTTSITVDAVGDRVVFHPTGCAKFRDSVDIG